MPISLKYLSLKDEACLKKKFQRHFYINNLFYVWYVFRSLKRDEPRNLQLQEYLDIWRDKNSPFSVKEGILTEEKFIKGLSPSIEFASELQVRISFKPFLFLEKSTIRMSIVSYCVEFRVKDSLVWQCMQLFIPQGTVFRQKLKM